MSELLFDGAQSSVVFCCSQVNTRSTGKGFNTMCKKIGIAAVAVVAGLIVLNHTKLGGWAKHTFHNFKEKVVTSVVKPEDEIRSLKEKLNDFGPKLREQINKMAEVKVEQGKKERDIADQTAWLENQRTKILALRDEVKSDTVKV